MNEQSTALFNDAFVPTAPASTPPPPAAFEKWGRGTNRVADMRRTAGVAPPDFAEIAGAAVVTFRVAVASAGVRPGIAGEVTGEVTGEVERLLAAMTGAMKRQEMQATHAGRARPLRGGTYASEIVCLTQAFRVGHLTKAAPS